MTDIPPGIDAEMTDFIRADRRKPLGYYAKHRIEETRDCLCWIQKQVRLLNKTNIESSGRQPLFEILDQTYLAINILDDVLKGPSDDPQM